MPPLPTDLRSQLESTVIAARTVAEEAAAAALTTLAVSRDDPFPAMNEEQRRLRRALRARARQLGAGVLADGMDALWAAEQCMVIQSSFSPSVNKTP